MTRLKKLANLTRLAALQRDVALHALALAKAREAEELERLEQLRVQMADLRNSTEVDRIATARQIAAFETWADRQKHQIKTTLEAAQQETAATQAKAAIAFGRSEAINSLLRKGHAG
jgi:hypothetical protein